MFAVIARWASHTICGDKSAFSSFDEALDTACILLLQNAAQMYVQQGEYRSIVSSLTTKDLSTTMGIISGSWRLAILMSNIPSETMRVDWWDEHEPVILSSWLWIDKKLRELEDASSSEEIRKQLLKKYQIQSTAETKKAFQTFVRSKATIGKLDRVRISELDWLLLKAICEDRCMGCGIALANGQAHIDRVYDDCNYCWGEMIIFFGPLNFAKVFKEARETSDMSDKGAYDWKSDPKFSRFD
ncbi:hypothetical protein BGZ97_011006 [Linnemannia gamsii]|uniref:Uncharacterized protein n=1 Tax=Linnemannia gamsii TaxID=64522 RepID=A0A9P6R9H2_9FUNG|nr:hypothetical protein BGZ97_011006 [Linnemannia gamsii]